MGVQINIEIPVLLKAGWKVSLVEDVTYEWDDKIDQEVEVPYDYLKIEKDDWTFFSYTNFNFCADCNHWGSNRASFIEAGLFDIEHVEG